ncbi:MAG: T9SS type A sorting domain-containing protein [Cytophagaceae bacterium]|nr:T9SS type A sorting domain-containing protein [Cytophagaceae bacterium]
MDITAVVSRPRREEEPAASEVVEQIQFNNDQIAFHVPQEAEDSKFHLFDINGIECKQQAVNSSSIVHTQDLNAGIYIAIPETKSGTIKKKIVVQR